MNKTPSVFESTAWYGLGNLFVRSVSFLLLPLYSNLITTEEFGTYTLLMSVYVIMSVFYHGGLHSVFTRYYLQEKDESKRNIIFSSAVNSILIISTMLTLVALIFSSEISALALGSADYGKLVRLTFGALFFENIAVFLLQLFKTKELSRIVVKYSAMGAMLNLALNLLLVYLLRMSIEGILISQLASSVLVMLIVIPHIRSELKFRIDFGNIRMFIPMAIPLMIGGLLSTFADVIDRFLLDHFLSRDDVGIYSFVYRIAMIMNLLVISFRAAWLPHSMNKFFDNDYGAFGGTLTKLIGVSSVVLVMFTIFTGYFFDLKIGEVHFFNPAYREGLVALPFILFGYMFNGIASFYYVYPHVSNKSYHILISDAIAFVTNLLLNLWLIPQIGILGAAAATAAAFVLSAVYLIIITSFHIKIQYEYPRLISLIILTALIMYFGINNESLIINLLLFLIFIIANSRILGINLKQKKGRIIG